MMIVIVIRHGVIERAHRFVYRKVKEGIRYLLSSD